MSTAISELKTAGERAYDRVRPLLERARTDLVAAAVAIGKEYDSLQKGDKQVFCERLGWTQDRVRQFAQVGREYPKKQRVITQTRVGVGPQLEDLGITHMVEITKTDDRLLKKAAKAGMFERPFNARDIVSLRQTGAVPVRHRKPPILSPLQAIKRTFEEANRDLNEAYGKVSKIRRLMEDNDVTEVKGLAVNSFFRSFEMLCAEIAAADPAKAKEALRILRGGR